MTIQDKRKEMTALIDNIKEHSDRLKDYPTLPLLELSVILSKITKLHEKAVILKYLSAVDQHYVDEEYEKFPFSSEDSTVEVESEEPVLEKEESFEEKNENTAQEEEEVKASTLETEEQILPEQEETETVSDTNLEDNNESLEEVKLTEEIENEFVAPEVPVSTYTESITEKQHTATLDEIEAKEELSSQPDVNEKFSEAESDSLSEQLKMQPIQDLLSSIGLNERYLYANELFDGDMEDFKKAMVTLNELDNMNEANLFFEQELKANYHWKDDDEMATALYQLVKRRFL